MTTNDLSQCKNCIYHYTYNGKDMCKQVGDDFYLQWKVEDCPYHTTITSAIKISDEIYRLRAENAALRERLEKAVELPAIVMIEQTIVDGKFMPTRKAQAFNGRIGVVYRDETKWKGLLVDICSEQKFDYEAAEARLAELKGGEK